MNSKPGIYSFWRPSMNSKPKPEFQLGRSSGLWGSREEGELAHRGILMIEASNILLMLH